MLRLPLVPFLVSFLVLGAAACGTGRTESARTPAAAVAASSATPQEAFWANLRQQCGRAYAGRRTVARPGNDLLTGTEELVVHYRQCGADTLKLPFHIERGEAQGWDRSRTWVFIRSAEGLELRHDHRHADGTPEENTWYGGHTQEPGTATRQEFVFEERRAPDGSLLGWRVEVVPGERYTYGTIRGTEWTWRVDFDLRQEVAAPPAPWGHEGTAAAR